MHIQNGQDPDYLEVKDFKGKKGKNTYYCANKISTKKQGTTDICS